MLVDWKKWGRDCHRFWAEMTVAPLGELNDWRRMIYDGRLVKNVRDPQLTHDIFTRHIAPTLPDHGPIYIADLACAKSFVARAVALQLAPTYQARAVPFGVDYYHPDLVTLKSNIPSASLVQGNLLRLPFQSNSIHAGVMRFALSFIKKNKQARVLRRIHRVLKPGALLVVMNDGAYHETNMAEAYDTLFAIGSACGTGRSFDDLKSSRHFLSCEKLMDLASRSGFAVRSATDLTETAIGYASPIIYRRGFPKMKDESYADLKRAFRDFKDQGVLPFRPGSLRVAWPMYACVLEKK